MKGQLSYHNLAQLWGVIAQFSLNTQGGNQGQLSSLCLVTGHILHVLRNSNFLPWSLRPPCPHVIQVQLAAPASSHHHPPHFRRHVACFLFLERTKLMTTPGSLDLFMHSQVTALSKVTANPQISKKTTLLCFIFFPRLLSHDSASFICSCTYLLSLLLH